jgi:poly-gamma-glutamate synthase PgsB/CapB
MMAEAPKGLRRTARFAGNRASMKLILLLFLFLAGLGVFEMLRHADRRRRIPIRIHVNGSRGKSSTTRLIAAGLRAGGIRTLAKTTGSAAQVIYPDGHELPVRRRGGPNIREQLRIFRIAVEEGAQAIVLECMAVRPDLQWTTEHHIVKATIGVITNVRPDHLEVMGPSMKDAAESLSSTVPRKAILVTAEDDFAWVLEAKARALGTEFRQTDARAVTREELEKFSYVEIDENLSLALAVCETAGVDRQTALQGMWAVEPDRGALVPRHVCEDGKEIEFVNLFAANDPESTAYVWEHIGLPAREANSVALINIRGDRMRRSKDLAPLFERRIRAAHYVLIGELTNVFAEILRREGVPREKIVNLGGKTAEEIWRQLMILTENRITVVGIGNIGGIGNELLDLIDSKEKVA